MAINTGRLTLGSSLTAPNTDTNQGAQTSGAPGSGASQPSTTTSTDGSSASGQKPVGPSAQTRNAPPSQSRGSSRAARARTNAASSTPGQPSAESQDATPESGSDFGSVMASALGRGAASTSEAPVSAAAGTDKTDSPTSPTPVQPAAGAPADAVAWFAQALLPPAAGAPASAATPHSADTGDSDAETIGSATTDNPVSTSGLPPGVAVTLGDSSTPRTLAAQRATHNAMTAAQFPGIGPATQVAAPLASQNQPGRAHEAAMSAASAAPTGDMNVLANAQKLISSLTAADSNDTDTDATAPKTHAALENGGTDATQATAALQASALIRPNDSLGAATLTIHAAVGSAAFADEVSARVTGLAQSGITQAQLQLNPADMGPVQVHITMQAGQASVWFGATHADTRAALEHSLPRLRELFAGAGMPLTDSGVFREPPQQQQAQSLPAFSNSRATLSDTVVAPTVTQVANIRLSLLDTYA